MKMCNQCGGAIPTQGVWHYAGPICSCPRPQQFQYAPVFQPAPLTYDDIKRAVREVLDERK